MIREMVSRKEAVKRRENRLGDSVTNQEVC